MRPISPTSLVLILYFGGLITAQTNFTQCLQNVRGGMYGNGSDVGGTDNTGNPVDVTRATGVTYGLCIRACGAGQEPFQWPTFSQQFSSWSLPWLALVSQLPFGANDNIANLESAVLALGSPVLAAYSVALTVLNGRWVAARFKHHEYDWPSRIHIVKALSSLQQAPLRITDDDGMLSSLIILPQNDRWWEELVVHLEYTHTWSISAVTSIIWVVVAYVFTVADSFTGEIADTVDSNGQAIGSLWLWLLPVVSGWLQISPKCDSERIKEAIKRSNEMAWVATPLGEPVLANSLRRRCAFRLELGHDDPLRQDERCTAPIYNYSRLFQWVQQVEQVANIVRNASTRASDHITVTPYQAWIPEEHGKIHRENRISTLPYVLSYRNVLPPPKTWNLSIIGSRMLIASAMALALQWGTTGAAIVTIWYTPTIGLGCRSASYLLYGVLSTISWFLMLLSSIISHYALVREEDVYSPRPSALRILAILLRKLAKFLAYLNSAWVLLTCFFQFTKFFDRCYCNSSVFGLRGNAFNVIDFSSADIRQLKNIWIGGIILAATTAGVFVTFVTLLVNPELPS
ncbi:hypothetical protein M422DRAFT_155160 [Sphaerobolus stellatus SS14]|nr:hypothetical protein M422DRAFT_155160 [Sphaerobolus stellatus SS14]